MNDYLILTDVDVRDTLSMADAVGAVEIAFQEMAGGTLVAPPRFRLDVPRGGLVFTAGAATERERVIGFRVYEVFPSEKSSQGELVAVFDGETGAFRGVVIGNLIGAMRTGAIGGTAVKYMARQEVSTLAVIGAGFQARTQLQAAMSVRPFRTVHLYSRTHASLERFKREILEEFEVSCRTFASAREAVEEADVVICATNSRSPVLETAWLGPGTHVNTVGPKTRGAQELPSDIALACRVIATDSIAQASSYSGPFFLDVEQLIGLEQIVAGKAPGRLAEDDITLFCSVGLAGTEVVVANHLFRKYQQARQGP